jgi:PIN domain nuclease of toxin-antitoxin system
VRYLVDTHVFLWRMTRTEKIRAEVRDVLNAGTNEVCVSLVVGWEIVVKSDLGKLPFPRPAMATFEQAALSFRMLLLPLRTSHLAALEGLPAHHRDPFDRLLVAQAIAESCTLITADDELKPYPVQLLWARA